MSMIKKIPARVFYVNKRNSKKFNSGKVDIEPKTPYRDATQYFSETRKQVGDNYRFLQHRSVVKPGDEKDQVIKICEDFATSLSV